jgi:hypothetical protein
VIRPRRRLQRHMFVEWFNVTGASTPAHLDQWAQPDPRIGRAGGHRASRRCERPAEHANPTPSIFPRADSCIPTRAVRDTAPSRRLVLVRHLHVGRNCTPATEGCQALAGFDVKERGMRWAIAIIVPVWPPTSPVQPLVDESDGFLIYSRGSGAVPLGDRGLNNPIRACLQSYGSARTTFRSSIRDRVRRDVLQYADARQLTQQTSDWEMAAGHQDAYAAAGWRAPSDLGTAPPSSPARSGEGKGGLLAVRRRSTLAQYAVLNSVLSILTAGTRRNRFTRVRPTKRLAPAGTSRSRDELGIAKGAFARRSLTYRSPRTSAMPAYLTSAKVFGHTAI